MTQKEIKAMSSGALIVELMSNERSIHYNLCKNRGVKALFKHRSDIVKELLNREVINPTEAEELLEEID